MCYLAFYLANFLYSFSTCTFLSSNLEQQRSFQISFIGLPVVCVHIIASQFLSSLFLLYLSFFTNAFLLLSALLLFVLYKNAFHIYLKCRSFSFSFPLLLSFSIFLSPSILQCVHAAFLIQRPAVKCMMICFCFLLPISSRLLR